VCNKCAFEDAKLEYLIYYQSWAM